jgi:8-oxo-dGTP pyrophosphatase MutT (NUDIX family)
LHRLRLRQTCSCARGMLRRAASCRSVMDSAEIALRRGTFACQPADGSCRSDGQEISLCQMAMRFAVRSSSFTSMPCCWCIGTDHGRDDWVLPGGTPREGESLAACARRELLEETGISADPSRVALIAESARPESGRRVLDVPFVAPEPVLGMARGREPGLEPHFVPPGQLTGLDLHPSLAVHLQRLADPGPHEHAAYVGNSR